MQPSTNSTDGNDATAALSAPAPTARKKGNLALRAIAALVLAPLVIWAILAGDLFYLGLILLALLLGVREWVGITGPARPASATLIISLLALLGVFGALLYEVPLVAGAIAIGSVPVLFLLARAGGYTLPWLTSVGAAYMAVSLISLWWLRGDAFSLAGQDLTFYLFFSVWAVDTGAYVAGRSIGGPKLAPKISPNKTWAGLFGGMVAAALVGWGWAVYCGANIPWIAALLGLPLAAIAQAGDIAESAIKRRFGVKDSGHIIPGHGGMLDRIDGLLLAAPVFVLFQWAVGDALGWWR